MASSRNTPDPVQWKQRPAMKTRILRAVSIPFLAGSVVFIVALTIAIAIVWAQPHVPVFNKTDNDSVQSDASPPDASPTHTSVSEEQIFVHVVGEVQNPGVIKVSANSRVSDVIDKAGGTTENADLASVNLARLVLDGEQIHIKSVAANALTSGVPDSVAESPRLVSINSADQQTLETLPRVGPSLAARIISWREQNGGFRAIEDLLQVEGIGNKTFEELRSLVSL